MAEGAQDQGGKHQEVKATIKDFFPLKGRFVLEAFKNLNPPNNSSDDVKKAVDEEIGILGRTNIYASISFGNLLEYHPDKTVAAQLRRGNAICHQALRLGANGELPKFTEEFVQVYDDEQDRKVKEELNEKQLKPSEGVLPRRLKNVARFREFEPEISKIVEKKLRAGSRRWRPEQDYIYAGFIDLYFLFREGCSNPKNFWQGS